MSENVTVNLQTLIKPQLWLAISNTYQKENYTYAILDAMHYLSDILREKSGLDGDGHALVGAALGGNSPLLRINKLQTETERSIQRGLEQILRGMYQGIRNPRSHEQIEDDKDTADAIIFFINYLLGILDQSQEPFTLPGYIYRVFDQHFVHSARYAELLVSEIPVNKQLDTLIEIYRRKHEGNGLNLEYVVKEILKQLSNDQVSQFLSVVSEEMKITQNNDDIQITLQILPPDLWPQLNETARLRTENVLIKNINEGLSNPDGETIRGLGALGTWSRDFLPYFSFKSRVSDVMINKLNKDEASRWYIFNFFLAILPSLYETSYRKNLCIERIAQAIKKEESGEGLMQQLHKHCWSYPEDWRNALKDALPDLVQEEDDIPF